MKKLFTLLFCVVAMGFAANAEESLVDQCINALLNQDQITTTKSAVLDVDHDGQVSIADATKLIDLQLEAQLQMEMNQAPAQMINVDTVIKNVLETTTGEPDINDVKAAIDQNIKQLQQ